MTGRALAGLLLLLPAILPPRAARAGAVDRDLVPGGKVLSTIFPSSETETLRVSATAGSVLVVDLRPLGRGSFRPSLDCVLADGTPVAPPARRSGKVKARLAFPVDGACTLRIGSASGGSGHYRLKTRLRPRPEGPRAGTLDLRTLGDPGALGGTWTLAAADLAAVPAPVALVGAVGFSGRGTVRTDLGMGSLPAPGGGLPAVPGGLVPLPAGGGSWFSDGAVADIALDLGEGRSFRADWTVAPAGGLLHAGIGDPEAAAVGLLLERGAPPTAASLAGTWTYAVLDADGSGGGTLEAGTLTFGSGGSVSGLGVRTDLAAGGEGTPLFRSGSLSAAADGTVTVTTRENLFGPTSAWTLSDAFAGDVLAGPAPEGEAGLRLLLRQGTGLGPADFDGAFVHLGGAFGATAEVRSGILDFDGAGGFSGTEAVLPLGGEAEGGVPFSGTYSVNSLGTATITPAGGAARTGVAGPGARTLFAAGAADGGLAFDLFLRTE